MSLLADSRFSLNCTILWSNRQDVLFVAVSRVLQAPRWPGWNICFFSQYGFLLDFYGLPLCLNSRRKSGFLGNAGLYSFLFNRGMLRSSRLSGSVRRCLTSIFGPWVCRWKVLYNGLRIANDGCDINGLLKFHLLRGPDGRSWGGLVCRRRHALGHWCCYSRFLCFDS